jgi:MFS family permease
VAGRGAGTAGHYAVSQARRAARAEGAGDSGLSRLIELHAFNAAGDAAVAISLAGTLFFQVPTGEARGQVALFLGLTMLPFAIVAPLIGPFLDRFSHGRRWAVGATMAIRCFLCWVLATAVVTESGWLFPAALGCLVASKAYGVTRAAAVPRLLPPDLTLVKANARVSLAGVVGAGISAPLAILASTFGPEWSLRYGFVVFVLATIWAIRLPDKVDASQGEGELVLTGESDTSTTRPRGRRPRTRIPAAVAFALRANCGPRWLSGFLTMFMAFLLRDNPIGEWRPEVLLGLVIGAAGLGNTLGITIGSVLKRLNPAVTVVLALVADVAVAALAAMFYGLVTLVLLGLTAGLAQSLAKLSLDSTIQRDVPGRIQASAFARSDTTLQLAWVIGGFVGIAMPLMPQLGLGIAAAVLGAWAAFVLVSRPGSTAPART